MAKTKDLKECKQAFQSAIAANFDGMWLKDGFAEELVKLYGLESLLYLCALTITNHDSDVRYSRKNKEWAKSIDITENEYERRELELNTHPAVLDGITDILLRRSRKS